MIATRPGVFRLTAYYRSRFRPIITPFFVPNAAPISNFEMLEALPPTCNLTMQHLNNVPLIPTGCSAVAHARYFTTDIRLHPIWQAGRTLPCNEAETGSLALGLIRSQSKSLRSFASHPNGGDRPASRARLPSHGGPLLRDERAIITADSFQSASRTRLGLALQKHHTLSQSNSRTAGTTLNTDRSQLRPLIYIDSFK